MNTPELPLILHRPTQQREDILLRQGFEFEDRRPTEQRRVYREKRVLRRRANQQNDAILVKLVVDTMRMTISFSPMSAHLLHKRRDPNHLHVARTCRAT